MPVWLTAFIAACWALIGPAINAFLAFWAGKYAQQQKDRADAAQASLNEITKADEAAGPVDAMSNADVLRDLQSRGRMRELP